MKKERRRKSKKELLRIQVLSACILALGVLALIVEAIIEKNCEANYYTIAMTVFFVSLVVSLILFGTTFSDSMYYEIKKRAEWANAPLSPEFLMDLSQEQVMLTFQRHGFKPFQNNMLAHKYCSLRLDFVHCFVRWITIEDDNAERAINAALYDIKKYLEEDAKRKRENTCVYLFLEMKRPDKEMCQWIQSFSKDSQHDTAPLPLTLCKAAVPIIILIDTAERDGCFWSPSGKADTVYAYGCRKLKKYFQANTVTAAGRRQSSGA